MGKVQWNMKLVEGCLNEAIQALAKGVSDDEADR